MIRKSIEAEVLKKVKLQIAHYMASYGDEPEELMIKLENLVLEWFIKGKKRNES